MRGQNVLAFIAGLVFGAGVGLLVASGLQLPFVIIAVGVGVGGFLAGVVVGGGGKQRVAGVRLAGRVFNYPQAPVLVEIALKRAGFVMRRGGR